MHAHDNTEEIDVRSLDRLRLEEVVNGELDTTALDRFGVFLLPDLLE